MNVSQHYTPKDTTLQPLNTDLWRRCRPKICSRVRCKWERDAQELTCHLKACVINRNRVSTESNAQDGRPVKRENCILHATQLKGAYLSMKPPHQSLLNPMPYGI